MIIALLAIAFAMIVGGLLAVVYGWDIVLVERGWTMVIAGSVMASGGALLLGIAAAVSRLARIETQLSRLQSRPGEETRPEPAAIPGGLSPAALSGGLVAAQAVAPDGKEHPDEEQATLPLFEEDRREPAEAGIEAARWPVEPRTPGPVVPLPRPAEPSPPPPPHDDEPDLKVPDFLLAERARDADEEPRVFDGVDRYHRMPEEQEPEPEPRDREEQDRRSEPAVATPADDRREPDLEPVSAEEPEREAESREEAEEDHPAVVVGTYNSGENRYVMFSDGSIEAQTPGGVFRFQSLDELKEFIAAGGEGSGTST